MHIILGHMGHVVIHHVRQFFDVESARRQISGHQYPHQACLEIRQRLGARALTFVAMYRRS